MNTRPRFFVPALLALAALFGAGAPAQANLLSNSSFEDPFVTNSYCYSCAVGGWSGPAAMINAGSGDWGNPQGLGGYSFGVQLVGLQNASYIEQSMALAAGAYQLTWSDAGRAGYANTAYDVYFGEVKLNASSFATTAGQAWSARGLSFTAQGPGTLRFQGLAISSDGTAFADNLALNAQSVPEPQSLALVTLALLGAGVAARRKTAR
ncbi:MAG: PEP-CTERM sorting domain-containing protein [Microbacteriaceae bacterium]|nr:PEP-CTERM sorting domain-containing protein [Burkholderiaceae bacterium]